MIRLDITNEVERSLFAGVLIDPSTLNQACQVTTGSQFADLALGKAFDLVADRYAAGLPVTDITVLVPEFKKAGVFEGIGGVVGLAELTKTVPSAANVIYHAGEVNRLFKLRKLGAIADDIKEQSKNHTSNPADITAKLEAACIDIASAGQQEGVSLSQMMDNLANQLDHDREAGTESGVPTGFDSVDLMCGGMFKSELVVLAARTSIGKTACGVQIALHAAMEGKSVLVMSLEMEELQLAQRVASSKAQISLLDQRTGNHSRSDTDRIRQFAARHRDTKLMIKPIRRAKASQIAGYARAMQATQGLDLLVIDYLQLISPRDRKVNRTEQVTEISGELKTMAMELNVPVLALAQLNRQGEGESPKLSHLRESGAIEQDADQVWFLHRGRDSAATDFIVEKNRQGPRGKVSLRFDESKCEFREPGVRDHPNYHPEFAEGNW